MYSFQLCAPWIFTHNVKMLHTIHNTPKFELIKSKQKVMAVMYKFHKAVPIAISNEIASMMVEEYKLSTEPELIYNPVDIARFDIEKKPHSGLKIVNVGRLSVQKNQKLLIDAIKIVVGRHSDVCLTVLGDGPLRSELENYVKEKGLEKVVYLMGNVDNVEKYFSESDIFVLSSTYEGLPLVILEAMAAQLPIVSTNVGGVKDIVTDNGILVAPNSTEALAEALEKLVKDGGLRNMLGKNSIKNVQRFDSVIIANQYMELYEKYSNN